MMMIGQAAASAPDVSSSMVVATQIFPLLDRQSEIDPFGEGGEKPSDVAGAVALKDVEFNYPSRPDVPVLRGMTAAVAPGKTLALVGESGSGKSTVVSLLERFYDIASGSLTLDESRRLCTMSETCAPTWPSCRRSQISSPCRHGDRVATTRWPLCGNKKKQQNKTRTQRQGERGGGKGSCQ